MRLMHYSETPLDMMWDHEYRQYRGSKPTGLWEWDCASGCIWDLDAIESVEVLHAADHL